MKGFKDSNNKFHPINQSKGVRKSRDQKSKQDGVKLRKQRETSFVGYSPEYIEQQGGKLISPAIKENMRKRVEKIFGNADLSPVIIFKDDRDPQQESTIRFESEIDELTTEMVDKIGDKNTYALHIVKVGRSFQNPKNKKIRIDTELNGMWAKRLFEKGEIT